MLDEDILKLMKLGQQLAIVGSEFHIAQIRLEKIVEKHGMSPDAEEEAARLSSELTQYVSKVEEGISDLKAQILAEG